MHTLRSIIFGLLAATALGSSLGAGCSVDNSGDAGGDPYAPPGESRYDSGGASPYRDDRYADSRYGDSRAADERPRYYEESAPPPPVAQEEQPLVPKTARLRAEGRGDLTFKSTRDGYVFIVDTRDKKLVYEGPLDEGETIVIAPYRNVIEVDGVRVKRVKDLDNKHIHRIFFEREGTRRRDRGR
jgi:hypothetical protein